jgi:hypothetical protein
MAVQDDEMTTLVNDVESECSFKEVYSRETFLQMVRESRVHEIRSQQMER